MLAIIDFLMQSPYLLAGVGLLVVAIALSVLSGLIDIAMYLLALGGVVLLVLGAANLVLSSGILFVPGAGLI